LDGWLRDMKLVVLKRKEKQKVTIAMDVKYFNQQFVE
jgi:hypothetical protein